MGYSKIRTVCLLFLAVTSSSLACADEPAYDSGLKTYQFSYQTESGETRDRSGVLWYPTTQAAQRYDYHFQIGFVAPDAPVADGKHPLILFSHGYLGSADQTIFLMEDLARHGYIVAAVNHADSLKRGSGSRPERPDFADVQSWTQANFAIGATTCTNSWKTC